MELSHVLLLISAGFGVGILAGFIGIGGNIVLIPLILLFLKGQGIPDSVRTHLTYGTMLLVTVFTALSSTFRMHRQKMILWRLVPWLVIGSLVSTQSLGALLKLLHGSILQLFFAVMIFVLGVRWFITRNQADHPEMRHLKILPLVASGFLIGVISLLTGLGGGILLVPLLSSYFFVSTKYLAGTSSAVLIFTALSAVISYLWSGLHHPDLPSGAIGYVLPQLSIIIGLGTIPGAQLGAYLNKKYAKRWFRLAFATLQLLMSSWMFWNLRDDFINWFR